MSDILFLYEVGFMQLVVGGVTFSTERGIPNGMRALGCLLNMSVSYIN